VRALPGGRALSETIGVVLPSRETFSIRKSGALALCARDFSRFSRFHDEIVIVGASPCEYPDVRYLRLENWRRWWKRGRTAYAGAVARAGRQRGWKLIEIFNRPPAVAVVRARLPGVKLALHLENDPQTMDGARTPAERARLLRQLDAVYCCSQFVCDKLLEGVSDEAGKTLVVHNGIDTEVASAPKEPIFAFVGRIIRVKGVIELVGAFALAAPDMPGWRLVIAGDDPEGLLDGVIARNRLGLEGKLTLLGQVSHAEAMALYARAEIAVTPSLWEEPFGRSAIEAMSRGCALISTARGGLAEVVAGAGEIVDPENTAGFAATLRRVALDADARRRLQNQALDRARSVFDIRTVTKSLDEARARLLGRE
jgi:glycosyltransferase involved in cell wall biosynthesis